MITEVVEEKEKKMALLIYNVM